MPEQPEHFDGDRNVTAMVGGKVYLDPETIRNATVLIDGGTIAAVGGDVPANANVIDCTGLTITAGFWNSHVHFFERKWANAAAIPAPELALQLEQTFTRYGFTSVFDIGSMWSNTSALRGRIESGEVAGPRIRSTGEGLVPVGGNPSDVVLSLMGVMKMPLPEVGDAAQATAAVQKLLAAGVDGIKLFISSPAGATIPEDAVRAAVEEVHRSGKPVFAHPNTAADALLALRAGVDVIAHTTPRFPSPSVPSVVKAALTPTLTLWKYFLRHDRISTQDEIVKTAIAQLRAWPGDILFGTDLGAVDYDPSEEYALMAQAGMSFAAILTSLTTAPAARFGAKNSGRIAAGCAADIVAFKDGPADVRYTLRDGRVIYK